VVVTVLVSVPKKHNCFLEQAQEYDWTCSLSHYANWAPQHRLTHLSCTLTWGECYLELPPAMILRNCTINFTVYGPLGALEATVLDIVDRQPWKRNVRAQQQAILPKRSNCTKRMNWWVTRERLKTIHLHNEVSRMSQADERRYLLY